MRSHSSQPAVSCCLTDQLAAVSELQGNQNKFHFQTLQETKVLQFENGSVSVAAGLTGIRKLDVSSLFQRKNDVVYLSHLYFSSV